MLIKLQHMLRILQKDIRLHNIVIMHYQKRVLNFAGKINLIYHWILILHELS